MGRRWSHGRFCDYQVVAVLSVGSVAEQAALQLFVELLDGFPNDDVEEVCPVDEVV